MMLKATEIRRGMVITMEGINFVVLDFAHHTPGNLRAMVQTKLRNMNNGSLIEKRLRSVDQIEVPFVEAKEYEYLYSAGDEHVFMDTETYDQLSFNPDIIGTAMDYLLPNSRVMVKYINDKPVSIEIPDFVELTVSDTPPSLAGATATNQYKEAKLETGLTVSVPRSSSPARRSASTPEPVSTSSGSSNRPLSSACRSHSVDDLARLLSDLVAIPSVNPMGRALPGPSSSRPADGLSRRMVRPPGGSPRATAGRAGPRQSAGLVRPPGCSPAASSSTSIRTRCRSGG